MKKNMPIVFLLIRENLLETISILSNFQIDDINGNVNNGDYNNDGDDNNGDDQNNGDYNNKGDENNHSDYKNNDNNSDDNTLVMMMSICKKSAASIRASCKSRRDVAAFHFDSTSDWQMWATLALNQLAEKAK